MMRALSFKATNPAWAFVAVIGAGLFLYVNHSTIASHFSSATPVVVEDSGIGHAPAIAAMGSLDTLDW